MRKMKTPHYLDKGQSWTMLITTIRVRTSTETHCILGNPMWNLKDLHVKKPKSC